MANSTRERFLALAESMFADRGFYGVSIAAIAEALNLTKQALLHHFGSKEKLYGAVLQRISDEYGDKLQKVVESEMVAGERLKIFLISLLHDVLQGDLRAQLLMRELLDNKRRAEAAGTWYLKSYLERLTDLMLATPKGRSMTAPQAFAAVYQLLGAINYYAISQPTLAAILGESDLKAVQDAFPSQFEALLDAVLAA